METIHLSTYPDAAYQYAAKDTFVQIRHGLEVCIPADVKDGDTWTIQIEPYTTPEHLSHTTLGKQLFITSPSEILSQIDGNVVHSPNDTKQTLNLPNVPQTSQPNFSSHSLVAFYNHLFILDGRTLRWTDLDNIWEWEPHPHNEADFRKLEWESQPATGLVRVENKLYIHFPNAIYHVTYSGKPTIVNIKSRVQGIGNITPRTLVVHNSIQFFLGTDNFYLFSVDHGLVPIGNDIWKRFIQDRSTIHSTWAYVDHRNNEICWVSGAYTYAFNFIERHWQKYSTDGILSHCTAPWTPPLPLLDESLTIISPDYDDGLENLWVLDGALVREARWGDDYSETLSMTQPFLESDDITYGDLHFKKRCDLMMVDARCEYPWRGVRVRVSGKDFVSHEENWVDCGLWRSEHRLKQVDFLAVSGRVMKYRFEMETGVDWDDLQLNGGLSLDGKWLDIADGKIIMDGKREDFLGRQFVQADGTRKLDDAAPRVGFMELNAWGERIDLPTDLVGPDK